MIFSTACPQLRCEFWIDLEAQQTSDGLFKDGIAAASNSRQCILIVIVAIVVKLCALGTDTLLFAAPG